MISFVIEKYKLSEGRRWNGKFAAFYLRLVWNKLFISQESAILADVESFKHSKPKNYIFDIS